MKRAFLAAKQGKICFDIPSTWKVITLADFKDDPSTKDVSILTKRALRHPSNSAPLEQRIKPRDKVAVLVEDLTRASPKGAILRILLRALEHAGVEDHRVTVVMSLGTHRALTRKELKDTFGEDVVNRYTVVNHDCQADDLVPVAKLNTGTPIKLNRIVSDAAFRIGLGSIFPHPLNGFGGGGKILFPGVADSESILTHHLKHSVAGGSRLGRLDGNPFYEEVTGIAKRVGLDFIINSVLDHQDRLYDVVAGDLMAAHLLGVQKSRQILSIPFEKKSDVTIISSFPYSDGLQIMKSLAAASMVTKAGGAIVLFADGAGGIPQAYAEACEAFRNEHGGRVQDGLLDCFAANRPIVPAGAPELNMSLARALWTQEQFKVILVTEKIPEDRVEKLGFQMARDLRDAFGFIADSYTAPEVNVVPSGGMILPVVGRKDSIQYGSERYPKANSS